MRLEALRLMNHFDEPKKNCPFKQYTEQSIRLEEKTQMAIIESFCRKLSAQNYYLIKLVLLLLFGHMFHF